ncbi:hypothetical protein C0993_010210 [Termitomyces sp. T159_Od127]|nr:hypothetical protein C0993_010210 [Termitomyces sp. T159_Od127]
MSSSSSSSPTPPPSDKSNVGAWAAYGKRRASFEHCQDCWRTAASHSAPSSAGGPSRLLPTIVVRPQSAQSAPVSPVRPSWPPLAPGVFHPVPAANRVAQADVTPAQFAWAVGRPQGPPTLAWCRQHGACSAPAAERSASCVAAKQGWALEWVQGQIEGQSRSRAAMAAGREGGARPGEAEAEESPSGSGEESSTSEEEKEAEAEAEAAPAPVVHVGLLCGKQRPSAVARGKRRASPLPEAGLSKRPCGDAAMAGPLGLHFFSPTTARPRSLPQELMEQSLLASTVELRRRLQEGYAQAERERTELAMATVDRDRARRDWDVTLAAVPERDAELTALRSQVAELELRVVKETPGESQAVFAARTAEREVVRQWDWALLEAASSQGGVLRWAWEHRLLLDGASAAHALLREGVGRMPFNLPAELDIGLAQLDILLAGHRRRNAIAPGSWLDVAVDTGEGLPVREEHLAALATQMEMAMLVMGPPVESQEGADEEGD